MPSKRANDNRHEFSGLRPGVLNHPSDVAFDRLAKLAARLLDVPVVLVTLATADQLYLPGIYGLGEPWLSQRTVAISQTLCQDVVATCAPLALESLRIHTGHDSSLLSLIGAQAYLGLPLRGPDGKAQGTICMIDYRARSWSAEDISALSDLTAIAETEIAMRYAVISQAYLSQYQSTQRSAFEQIAAGKPLSQSLSTLALGIEGQIDGVKCAIMLLDESQLHLYTVAAPSLHPTYSRMIDGIRIGPQAGSCGTAAFSGKPVVTTDIAIDPLWAAWRDLALSYDLRACWSIPVFDSTGQTLGAFAIYDQVPRHPTEAEFDLVLGATNVVAVAVERWRTIDALRSSEARLRRSEANLAAVFEHASDAIWSVDNDLQVVTINGRAVTKLRVMTGAIVRQGVLFDQGMPDSQRVFWRSLYRRALNGERFSIEQPYTDGGMQRWCEISLNPIHMDGGISGISVFSRDLTERKRAEAERLAMERSWQETQRLESLGVLAGGIAHDFNNLLATILGNAELALLDLDQASPIHESVEQVELAARRAAEMTQQILAYAGKGRVSIEPINLNAMVREMGTLLRSTLLRQAPISYALNHCLPTIEGDTAQLRQVVMNLIVNAAEAISGGPGAITVTTDLHTYTSRSSMGFDPPPPAGVYVCLEVHDSGPGMSRATMARIFEPFFTTKFTGRGLGLAAVQGIVRSHGGALRVESAPGEGTTFTVLLPALESSMGNSPDDMVGRASGICEPTLGTGTILVIDDEPTVLQLTTRLLRRLGYTALDASSHTSAVELLQQHRASVRCVLLDWTMPGHSGETAFRILHAQSEQTPIIVMSGYGEQAIFETTAEIKPAGFLHKPFSAEMLQRMIAQATAPLV